MIHYETYSDFPDKANLTDGDKLSLRSGEYTIASKLGQGGFASVYKIVNSTGDEYAFKFMDLTLRVPEEYDSLKSKFQGEFRVGSFQSDYIVRNFYIGMISGNPYIIMELCPNGNLVTQRHRYKSESDYNMLAHDILNGLKDLHSNGVIHRDIKPENILFCKSNKLKLADFGISGFLDNRLTIPGLFGRVSDVFGSVQYCPNEALDRTKSYKYTKPTMDIYSFGITMYYVISGGELPFKIESTVPSELEKIKKLKRKQDYRRIENINRSVSAKWQAVIEKCLKDKPEDRFQSVDEVIDFLGIKDLKRQSHINEITGECLVVTRGEEEGKIYELPTIMNGKSRITVGRHPSSVSNDLPILETNSTYVSSRHATIEVHEGNWFIRDGQFDAEIAGWKQSLNHTIVNYYNILQDQQAIKLSDGDIIQMGDVVFKTFLNKQN